MSYPDSYLLRRITRASDSVKNTRATVRERDEPRRAATYVRLERSRLETAATEKRPGYGDFVEQIAPAIRPSVAAAAAAADGILPRRGLRRDADLRAPWRQRSN